MNKKPRNVFFITIAVAIAGLLLVYIIQKAPISWVEQHRSTLVSAVWLYLPLPFILRSNQRITVYGVSWGTGVIALAETFLVCLAILIPFYLLYFHFYPVKWTYKALPANFFSLLIVQLLVIALPEEFFFRAYLQTELESLSRTKWKILGAEVGLGWLSASFIFAIAHLVTSPYPSRLLVFFPSLVFGWCRARTKSVLYPALMHAVFNFTFLIAQRMAR